MFLITSGKGGVGKTTLAASLMRWFQAELTNEECARVLCVDADPVGIMSHLLGAEDVATVTERYDGNIEPAQLTLEHAQDMVYELPEGGHFISMGHHAHEGCACKINALMRAALTHLASQYPIIIMDNEAGLEHMTRGTSSSNRYKQQAILFLVIDTSAASIQVAANITKAVRELDRIDGLLRTVAVRVPEKLQATVIKQAAKYDLVSPVFLPNDDDIATAQLLGVPFPVLPQSQYTGYMAELDTWLKQSGFLTEALTHIRKH